MKTINIVGIGIFFLLLSCTDPRVKEFVINGQFSEYANEQVSLLRQFEDEWKVTDYSMLDSEGRFSLSGELNDPEFVYLTLKKSRHSIRFFLENENITININSDSMFLNPEITGAKLNTKFEKYTYDLKINFQDSMMVLYSSWNDAVTNNNEREAVEMDSLRGTLLQEKLEFQVDFVRENSSNVLAPFVLNLFFMELDFNLFESLVNELDPGLNSSLYTRQVKQKVHAVKATLPGQPFIDFSLPDSNGQYIQLSTLVEQGNYLVIDFWASYNSASNLEMEIKRTLYKKYFNQGLEFVGVSLDTNREGWRMSLEETGPPWIQLIDIKGPRGKTARDYLILGLPFKLLLDPSGMIVARVETIKELEAELESIFE